MQSFTRTHRTALTAGVICYLFLTANTGAQIVTDGSVGAAQSLSGPDFSIAETLGTTVGANLFHSFEQFNILTGQSATFSGASEIANVISRVTGGELSTIDGLLRSTIGQADFYFLNPAGVMFGANAQVDVPGSFYVSTADQLRFADGSIYDASNPAASTLSVDQPASFGFLGNQTATISVVGSNLELTPGKTLSITAGDLEIEGAQLLVEQGKIHLVAVGDAANTATMEGNLFELPQGKLNITDSRINASGGGSGRIVISGGEIRFNSGTIIGDVVTFTTGIEGLTDEFDQPNSIGLPPSIQVINPGETLSLRQLGVNILTYSEANILDIDHFAQTPCAISGGRLSRLARLGRGGLPETPEQPGSVVIDADRLQRLLPRTEPIRHALSESAQPIAARHGTLAIAPSGLSTGTETEC